MAFWVLWDHLGKLMVANVCIALVILLPGSMALTTMGSGEPALMILGLALIFLGFGCLAPALAAGIAALARELIETRDGSLATFFGGIRLHGLRAAGVGMILCFVAMCLLASAGYYALHLGATWPWVGYVLSAAALWTMVFVGLCVPFVWPALVHKKASVAATLKLSAALVLDNPLLAVGLAGSWLCLLALSAVPPLFLLVTPAAALVLSGCAYELLARKYAAGDAAQDAEDDYLNRGFRDLLFPWKS
jgi:uncharacterized membrane protein YesL